MPTVVKGQVGALKKLNSITASYENVRTWD